MYLLTFHTTTQNRVLSNYVLTHLYTLPTTLCRIDIEKMKYKRLSHQHIL